MLTVDQALTQYQRRDHLFVLIFSGLQQTHPYCCLSIGNMRFPSGQHLQGIAIYIHLATFHADILSIALE
jgi:hypothetical protein